MNILVQSPGAVCERFNTAILLSSYTNVHRTPLYIRMAHVEEQSPLLEDPVTKTLKGCNVIPSSITCGRRLSDGRVKPRLSCSAKAEGNRKASQPLYFQVVLQVFPAVALL